MSTFDENPFQEPTVDNPFADPSVQQITKQPTNIGGLDDYNPFDPASQQKSTAVRGASNPPPQYVPGAGPAIMTPSSLDNSNVPSYNKSSQQVQPPLLTTSELQKRQEELDKKAAELERREQELRRSEVNVRRNNWPPLPDNCIWQPCFYLDINVEIQPEFQKIVTQLYHLWILHASLLVINIIVHILALFLQIGIGKIVNIFMAVIYGGLFIPLSFLCWFRPAYKAFRDDSSFNFMVFFFIFSIQFVAAIFYALGFIDGICGLKTAYEVIASSGAMNLFCGLIMMCVAGGFCIAAAADFYLLTKIHNVYRSSGASFAKAQAEFTTEFLRNEHVRGAATNVAQAAVRQQFSQSQQSPTNRY